MKFITLENIDKIPSKKRYSKFDFDWSETALKIGKVEDSEYIRQAAFRLTSAGSRDFTIPDEKAFMMCHSPTRADLFWIEMYHIPNYLHIHLVRHAKFAEHYVRTGRDDRQGPDNETRWTGKDHGILTNAQEIMQIARMRLCEKADDNANFMIDLWKIVLEELSPSLAKNMVPKCAYRQRWSVGNRTIQYCAIRASNRTFNGLLKVKVGDPACDGYIKIKKGQKHEAVCTYR